jgi:predicted dehydrogenase
VLASPTHVHADQAIAAMERGIDVFCDKPIAPTLAETDRMVAAAGHTGRKLMVYQPHRVLSDTRTVRHILDSGVLGDIFMIKRTMAHYTRRNDWQAFTQYGGGMLNNYGAHAIDGLLYLTGARAADIRCELRRIATRGDADDVVKALIRLDSGVLLDLEINMACAVPVPAWTVLGSRGSAILQDGETFTVHYYDLADLPDLPTQDGLAAAKRQYGNDEVIPWRTLAFPLADFPAGDYYAHCYDYFALNKAPFVPLAETRELMRVIDACRQSAGESVAM